MHFLHDRHALARFPAGREAPLPANALLFTSSSERAIRLFNVSLGDVAEIVSAP